MPRRRDDFHPGKYYHVYNRGVDRDTIFFERSNYGHFLKLVRRYLLGDIVTESSVVPRVDASAAVRDQVICYCLMPNHYHLLVKIGGEGFSDRMASLGKAYTQALNRWRDRVGPLFQSRFRAIEVDEECYLLHLSRYIHLNPVRAKLVASPERWEFSSYLEFVGERGGSIPDFQILLSEIGGRERYRRFVEDALLIPTGLKRYLIGA